MLIYKFRSSSSPFTNCLVNCGQINFSDYTQLNDPLEFCFNWDFSGGLKKKLTFWETKPSLVQNLADMKKEAQLKYIAQIEKTLNKKFPKLGPTGIFSASKSWKNYVMWSHYADSHRGICIEIETNDSNGVLSQIESVKYKSSKSSIKLYDRNLQASFNRAACTKYIDWKYENEIRVFGKPGLATLPSSAIKAIYFGLNFKQPKVWPFSKSISQMAKYFSPNVKFYRVHQDKKTNSLYEEDITGIMTWL